MAIAGVVSLAGDLGMVFAPSLGHLRASGLPHRVLRGGLRPRAPLLHDDARAAVVPCPRAVAAGRHLPARDVRRPLRRRRPARRRSAMSTRRSGSSAAASSRRSCWCSSVPTPRSSCSRRRQPPARTSTPKTRASRHRLDPAATSHGRTPPRRARSDPGTGVFRTMWRFRRVLSTLGLAAASLSAVRSARQVVLPLWGVSIGLDAQTIALVVGISGAIDFALFYASGQVMDRFGRLWAALPAMILMGAGFLALAFTHDLPQAAMWFAMFAAVLGVGNGLSSGILLTLGADVAPQGGSGRLPRLVAHAHRRRRRGRAAAGLGHRRGALARHGDGSDGRRRTAGRSRVRALGAEIRAADTTMTAVVRFCRSRNGGRRCTRHLGHAGLHRHRTIMWADAAADPAHCPGSGEPGTPAAPLADGFPDGRAMCPVCHRFVALDADARLVRPRHDGRERDGCRDPAPPGVVQRPRLVGRRRSRSHVRPRLGAPPRRPAGCAS